jgi:hypothetical protein
MERWTFESQQTEMRLNGRADNLYQPVAHDGGERGRNWSGHTRSSSVYTRAFLHPIAAAVLLSGITASIAASFTTIRARRRRRPSVGAVV